MQRNCYDILGVDCKASTEEIKIAFRQLAKQWHPDLNPQLSRRGEQFTHIHQAYRILCNPKERALHDAELKSKPHPQKPEASHSRPKPSANAKKKATPKNT
ncbi:MAG: DnaJ domain-containing protein, partial [Desulfuromonadaceae bacterium]